MPFGVLVLAKELKVGQHLAIGLSKNVRFKLDYLRPIKVKNKLTMGFFKKLLGETTDELQKRLEEARNEVKRNLEEARDEAKRKLEEVRGQAQRKLEEVRLASNTEEVEKSDSDIAKDFEDVEDRPEIMPDQLHNDDSPDVYSYLKQKREELQLAIRHKNDSPEARENYKRLSHEYGIMREMVLAGATSIDEIENAVGGQASDKSNEPAPQSAVKKEVHDDGMFSARLEALISSALKDGVLTEKEREVIKHRAEAEGENWDEVEMIIESRLAEMQSNTSSSIPSNLPIDEKRIQEKDGIELNARVDRGLERSNKDLEEKNVPEEKGKKEKEIWGVENFSVSCNGNKYALLYSGKPSQRTKYIYDDVDVLNENQVRLAQKQADGSYLYGVASTRRDFIISNCEYTKVTFLDGDNAVLAIDEDGDEYAIDSWGNIYSIEGYREKVAKDLEPYSYD